jgi:hypothetical protein
MKSQFKISGKLIVAALLVSILALPAVATPQTPDASNASLADTLTWLKSFLPMATGATTTGADWNFRDTSSITYSNGCNLAIFVDYSADEGYSKTYTFSLSDIDPSQVRAHPQNDVFDVSLSTRGGANAVKFTSAKAFFTNQVDVDTFADQASAQRAANAFQHAAQLCANAQPF